MENTLYQIAAIYGAALATNAWMAWRHHQAATPILLLPLIAAASILVTAYLLFGKDHKIAEASLELLSAHIIVITMTKAIIGLGKKE